MTLKIDSTGVFLDGQKVPHCERVDIDNINYSGGMTAILHVPVGFVNVQYGGYEEKQRILREERGQDRCQK